MDSPDNATKSSIHAERAYALIMSGVAECKTARDQLIQLNSIICQCAVFTRILSGEQELHELLERLMYVDTDVEGGLLSIQRH
ncbi:Uncharacterised protein [Pseudomonas fluorescens]|uniref:Uncharacterized protein n=1 Tax=Pseudomonas fluorescens TaxID=294 RepID=A0A379IF77_PSEFL|nr:hypothetical protein [Pseudomonas fluorescens]SUD31449.1 Uncharacterised protein [Pseudomonas fluorescens]